MGHEQKTRDEDDTLLVRNNEAVKPWSNFFRVQIKSTKKKIGTVNLDFHTKLKYPSKMKAK